MPLTVSNVSTYDYITEVLEDTNLLTITTPLPLSDCIFNKHVFNKYC